MVDTGCLRQRRKTTEIWPIDNKGKEWARNLVINQPTIIAWETGPITKHVRETAELPDMARSSPATEFYFCHSGLSNFRQQLPLLNLEGVWSSPSTRKKTTDSYKNVFNVNLSSVKIRFFPQEITLIYSLREGMHGKWGRVLGCTAAVLWFHVPTVLCITSEYQLHVQVFDSVIFLWNMITS